MKYLKKYTKHIDENVVSYDMIFESNTYDLNKLIDQAYIDLKGKTLKSKDIFDYIIDNLTDGELSEELYNELYKKVTGYGIGKEFDDIPLYIK